VARGKVISVYLIDGVANGKIKATITNWNGIAYKIPRGLLDECKELEAFKQSGVYFLFGNNMVYVGQAEVRKNGKGIHQRILDHENDKYKDCWDEVVIFTRKDNSLGRTDISYLENRFYNKALEAGRFHVQNGNEPTIGTVTEEKESELEEYIDQAELVLGALGYKVFEPRITLEPVWANSSEETIQGIKIPDLPEGVIGVGDFILQAMRNLEASGYIFSDEQMQTLLNPVECNKKELFNLQNSNVAFFKLYNPDEEKPHYLNGMQRYYTPKKVILTFGKYKVLLTKEWYDKYNHRELFKEWYMSLKNQ
jgi:hypothetical protein